MSRGIDQRPCSDRDRLNNMTNSEEKPLPAVGAYWIDAMRSI
jgi:hypothetical protein